MGFCYSRGIKMIQLLFLVLFVEGAVAFLLMVKIGLLRELVIRGLDQLKTGKGPVTLKTLAITMSLLCASSITSILRIQSRTAKLGTVTPMDQVLWRTHLLEASLIGYSLFLGFIIDRVHHFLQKLINLRMTVVASKEEIEKLKKENSSIKEQEEKTSREKQVLEEEISKLKENLKKLKLESEEKEKRAVSAEVHVASLQKQSEDLLLEYDRLLEDNQILQRQITFRS